mgnify:CR=1 FL=1
MRADNIFSLFYLKETKQILRCSIAYSATIFYRDFKIDLLTGEKSEDSLEVLKEEISKLKINDELARPHVLHLFYELGFLFTEQNEYLPAHEPLAIIIKYNKASFEKFKSGEEKTNLELKDFPTFKNYKLQFDKVQEHLRLGNCYQVNLTQPFYFNFDKHVQLGDFINFFVQQSESLSAYAHCTYIECLDKLLFSNSPECLFKIYKKSDDYFIRSMPIKGTVEDLGLSSWKNLIDSKKEQAELFMISDLVRNDLAKISFTPAKIIKKRMPLKVPGILHQFSIIDAPLNNDVTIWNVLNGLFPGGSITGAPKKRVMQIINELESYTRGFYCGSTVLLHKGLKCGSINIRSAEISFDKRELKYPAGGGITMLSEVEAEFKETYQKMKSFLQFLKVDSISKT